MDERMIKLLQDRDGRVLCLPVLRRDLAKATMAAQGPVLHHEVGLILVPLSDKFPCYDVKPQWFQNYSFDLYPPHFTRIGMYEGPSPEVKERGFAFTGSAVPKMR